MQDNTIIEQVGHAISKQGSAAEPPFKTSQKELLSKAQKHAIMDAVDQLFAEFELTYHNQYLKAFPSTEKLSYAKKLWFDYLKAFSPARIIQACRKATRESEYLPTVHTVIKHCETSPQELGLPDSHQAYIEACQASSPKVDYAWSHPAVYWAGKASDWFFLANNIENKALPVFKRNYEMLCERIKQGETLSDPLPIALPAASKNALSSQQRQANIRKLRAELKL